MTALYLLTALLYFLAWDRLRKRPAPQYVRGIGPRERRYLIDQ